jgi:hypothetical protein
MLSRVLALLLVWQVGLAPALCLARMLPRHAAMEICTPEGLRTVSLPAPPSEGTPAPTAHDGFCPACHALPQAGTIATPILPRPAWVLAPAGWDTPRRAALPPAIRGPPGGARAPPASPA